MISKIMEVDAVNKNILKIIAFDNSMPSKEQLKQVYGF